ncbi:MAG: hypothetical protein Q8R47_06520 [Nanoarchaeota archaeon]|nr:hypothetical protein [Nanoarchaeota archaeon]
MSKNNSQKEIEDAHKKLRGELKSDDKKAEEKRSEQKKDSEKSIEKAIEKTLEKNEGRESTEKGAEKTQAELAEEQAELEEQERKPGKETDLEEITRKAQPLPAGLQDSPYVQELSHKPMTEIYKEIKDIYKIVEDKGYLSPSEQRQVEYLSSAVERKFQDEEEGIYSFSEQAARAASITQHLSATMMGAYKGKKMNEMYK